MRRHDWVSICAAHLLLAVGAFYGSESRAETTGAGAQIEMNRIAVLPSPADEVLAHPLGFDLDGDGNREFVFMSESESDVGVLEFWESDGNDSFSLVQVLELETNSNDIFLPADVGDFDQDGIQEFSIIAKQFIVGGGGLSNYGEWILEGVDPASYPTEIVWTHTAQFSIWPFGAQVADGDGDGLNELYAVEDNEKFIVFENVRDNVYVETYSELLPDGLTGQSFEILPDIDMDGKPEILFGAYDRIFAFESTGDDAYSISWVWDFSPNNSVSFIMFADDLDGDGLDEFVAGGSKPNSPLDTRLHVFEATGDNQVQITSTIIRSYGGGFASAAVVDVDGDGANEIVFSNYSSVAVYKASGPDSWESAWSATANNIFNFGAGDHDKDGKAEVIFRSGSQANPKTSIWEIDPAFQADLDADDVVDAIDNCALHLNPGQEDLDGDGVGDACDNCVSGPNPSQGAAMFGQTLIAADGETFSWETLSDVAFVKGDLAGVSSYSVLVSGTLASATSLLDPLEPGSAAGFYYLLRPDCAVGSWQSTPGAEPLRDLMLP